MDLFHSTWRQKNTQSACNHKFRISHPLPTCMLCDVTDQMKNTPMLNQKGYNLLLLSPTAFRINKVPIFSTRGYFLQYLLFLFQNLSSLKTFFFKYKKRF